MPQIFALFEPSCPIYHPQLKQKEMQSWKLKLEQSKDSLCLKSLKSQERIEEKNEDYLQWMRKTKNAKQNPHPLPKNPKIEDKSLLVGSVDQVIVKKFNVEITRKTLSLLSGSNKLNDEIINFFFNLLQEKSKKNLEFKIQYFNSFFYEKLSKLHSGYNYSAVERWTKNDKIFENSKILIPIHLPNHWTLAVVNFISQKIIYYDSLAVQNATQAETIQKNLFQYLKDEFFFRKTALIHKISKLQDDIPSLRIRKPLLQDFLKEVLPKYLIEDLQWEECNIEIELRNRENDLPKQQFELQCLNKNKFVLNKFTFETKKNSEIPQQTNGFDCGVFVCQFAVHLSTKLDVKHDSFSQSDIKYFREMMLHQIANGELD